ncbi:UNVERIFIED_CONTAM: hypothetical protein Sradi_5686800 [Sesamum radiatum]|uniref:Uncharacterized protein n=1 Tax=Sesamum radiatum TaxID=300843 RepID=A0AAW2L0X3_SESRA
MEGSPFQTLLKVPPPSPTLPPTLVASSSLKRHWIEETGAEEVPPMTFPASVPTPRLDPKAGVFNMTRVVHRSDVEGLSSHSMHGLEHFLLAQTSTVDVPK